MRPPSGFPRRTPWRLPTWRIVSFVAIVALAFGALVARLVTVQLTDGERYRAAAQANQIRLIPVAAPRGVIYDRNGAVMARSRPSFVVGLIPSEVRNVYSELATLATMLGVDEHLLRYRLLHHRGVSYANFEAVAQNEPYGPVILAADLPVPVVAR